MVTACFVIPGDLSLPTGGYGYDREVLAHAGTAGIDLRHLPVPGGFPFPDEAILRQTALAVGAAPADAVLLIDGLAYGAMPDTIIREFRRPIIELCHHPLALEPGIDTSRQEAFRASERAAMALADHIIVTGKRTGETVAGTFGVPPDRITVAEPGTARTERAKGSAPGRIPRLLAVGSIIPRKAYPVMIKGLSSILDLPWTLDIVGAREHAPDTVAALEQQIADSGLGSRVTLHGAQSETALKSLYSKADLFVMTSLYEGYGMVIAEALARGLPIVAAAGGAVADTLPDGAGIKVPPGDAPAFASSVRSILIDDEKKSLLSNGSWAAGQRLPTWADTARTIADVIRKVAR